MVIFIGKKEVIVWKIITGHYFTTSFKKIILPLSKKNYTTISFKINYTIAGNRKRSKRVKKDRWEWTVST